jgi:Ulp1 family protease catalytic subunit
MIAAYLSDNWLNNEHMHQFTQILEHHFLSNVKHAGETYILGPWFSTHLSQYDNSPNHPYLEHIGNYLASGHQKCIVTMWNVDKNHWITLVIDSYTASIAISDSFKKLHSSFISVVSQWVERHMKCI